MTALQMCTRLFVPIIVLVVLMSRQVLAQQAEWTVMIYGAYDSTSPIPSLMPEFSRCNAPADHPVNVVFYEDLPGPDNTAVYLVGKGRPVLLQKLEEPDTGDGKTLLSFVKFAMSTYPAKRYMLHLVGHSRRALLGMCTDGGSVLVYEEIQRALESLGKPLDVLSLVSCASGSLEVFYKFRNVARLVVGSQNFTQGYDDVRWAKALLAKADLDPRQVAYRIADGLFKRGNRDHPQATVACDASQLDGVASALKGLVDALLGSDRLQKTNKELLRSARKDAQELGPTYAAMVDLGHLAKLLAERATDPGVKAAAEALVQRLRQAIVTNCHDDREHRDCTGLNILFISPESRALGRYEGASCYGDGELMRYEIYGPLTNWGTFVALANWAWDGGDPSRLERDSLKMVQGRAAIEQAGDPDTVVAAIDRLLLEASGSEVFARIKGELAQARVMARAGNVESAKKMCLDAIEIFAPRPRASGIRPAGRLGRIHVEVDTFEGASFPEAARGIVKRYFESLGVAMEFVDDEDLGAPPSDAVSWNEMRTMAKTRFAHAQEAGWHHLVVAPSLVGQIGGWGNLNGKSLFVVPKATAELSAKIFTHEFGHNLSLRHEGVDETGHTDLLGQKAPCPMYAMGSQPDGLRHLEPVLAYCARCAEKARVVLASDRYPRSVNLADGVFGTRPP